MTHKPHDLVEEFPESAEQLHALKMSSPHFSKLFEEYHEVNRQINRMETRVEPASEELEMALRRKRMVLKDEIYAGLKAASAAKGGADGKSDD
ncbi:DUF465 domain-containing protein [Hyphomonas sp.]|uniref:YdcH family protein n=1 Tax=Hyphomonas sp. TaxID=87 RepID=UPI0025BC9F71|nr:DUF465 domain-containing protein [Hyphomonas sp.]